MTVASSAAVNRPACRGRDLALQPCALPAAEVDSTAIGPTILSLGRGETVLVLESEREQMLRDEEMLAGYWIRTGRFRASG